MRSFSEWYLNHNVSTFIEAPPRAVKAELGGERRLAGRYKIFPENLKILIDSGGGF